MRNRESYRLCRTNREYRRSGAAVGAVMSAGLLAIGLAVAPVQPVRGAVTCASWAQGTLADDGTWTAGAASSDTDARTVCTSNTVNDTLRFTDLEAASNYPDPATTDRLVIDVSDSGIGYVDLRLDDNEDGEMIVTGALGGSGKNAIRYILSDLEPGQEDEYFKFTSLATISASGTENRGIYARNMDTGHRGRLEWTNGGAITTTGNLGHGLDVRSDAESAKAEARAVNKGAITTSGSGRAAFTPRSRRGRERRPPSMRRRSRPAAITSMSMTISLIPTTPTSSGPTAFARGTPATETPSPPMKAAPALRSGAVRRGG